MTARFRRLLARPLALTLVVAACVGGNQKSVPPKDKGVAADPTKPAVGGRITYALEGETPGGLCLPEAQLDTPGIEYARAVYDTLTAPDENGNLVPFLASKIERNADATVWTITLRDGVKFHNGSDLTATVIKNNLDAYRGRYPTRHPLLFAVVLGPYIRSIAADDSTKTVSVTTNQPWASFDAFLWSNGRLGIMAQQQLDEGAECAHDLIGTGPFSLSDWVINDHFTVVRNPNYWETDDYGTRLPYLDQITFKPVPDGRERLDGLQSGRFQALDTASSLEIEQLRVLARQGTVTNNESDKFAELGHLMLCVAPPSKSTCPGSPFSNEHARRAVALALDRQKFNHVRAHDLPNIASGPFAPGSIGFLDEAGFPNFDLDEAKKEVQLYKQDTGTDLAFTMLNDNTTTPVEDLNFVRALFEAAGMQVSTSTVGRVEHIRAAIDRNFQLTFWSNFPGGDPDLLYAWWHCSNPPPSACDNPFNFGGFNDPQINRDLDEARIELDPGRRRAIYEDLNRQFSRGLYLIWTTVMLRTVSTLPGVHGVLGPRLPDGAEPFRGLATGHPMSGLFVSP